MRKTKIICTIGPVSESKEMLRKLADAGMNIIRLNFSHGSFEEHGNRIINIRKVEKEIGQPIGILLDTKGPEIRCGEFEDGGVAFKKGDIVSIVKEVVIGNKQRFHVQCPELFSDLEVDDYLLIDDGKVKLTITKVEKGHSAVCRVENNGVLKTKKGINVPNVKLSMPFISEKDDADLRFGCSQNVDYVAASFVRRAADVVAIREILLQEGKKTIKIIAKIENQEGYDNLDEILEVSDGVMVARGDLGVEVSTALVPLYQKKIVARANEFGKPVVTATHMLESMITTPRPTRAEASDVANAIFDGNDAIMLSGETAAGDYPVEAVMIMDLIATEVENILNYREKLDHAITSSQATIQDAIGASVANACLTLAKVKAIVAFTQGGSTARRISKFRPNVPILAVTFTRETEHNLTVHWGVVPVFSKVQNDLQNDDELASEVAKRYGLIKGDQIIITAGYPTGEGTANMMKIIELK